MAFQLPLYFSLLLLASTTIVSSASRHAPETASKLGRNNGGMVEMNKHFVEPRVEVNSMVHRLLAGHDEMIGLHDYGDARANHRHDPHHPVAVKGNNKELDG